VSAVVVTVEARLMFVSGLPTLRYRDWAVQKRLSILEQLR